MKRILLIISLFVLPIVITGCTLIPTSTKKETATSTADGGVFRSPDFGERWEQRVTVRGAGENQPKTIANVNTGKIVFDPVDQNTMYLLSVGSGVYRSTSAGDDWQPTTLSSGTYTGISIDTLNNKVMYLIQSNKIIKTVDGMGKWHDIYFEKRPKQTLVSVSVDRFKSSVVYAASTTSIIKSTNYGYNWELSDWKKPTIRQLYLSEKRAGTLYILTSSGIYLSTDSATTWNLISEPLKQWKGALTIYWFDFDPATENIIMGTQYGVIRSLDSGTTWEPVSTLFDVNKRVIKSVIYNPNNPQEILFSIDNILYKTTDNGQTWQTLKTIKTNRLITYLIADPYRPNTIYAGTTLPPKK